LGGPHTQKSHGNRFRLYGGIVQHLPVHGAQCFLDHVGHMEMSVIVQPF
jgi:hypothetical protein